MERVWLIICGSVYYCVAVLAALLSTVLQLWLRAAASSSYEALHTLGGIPVYTTTFHSLRDGSMGNVSCFKVWQNSSYIGSHLLTPELLS